VGPREFPLPRLADTVNLMSGDLQREPWLGLDGKCMRKEDWVLFF
jgi:hypothetical protein